MRGCWRALPIQQRRRLLEGLPEAAALAGDSGDGTAMGCSSSSSNSSSNGHVDLVHNLLLAPVAWCFKVREPKAVLVSSFSPHERRNPF